MFIIYFAFLNRFYRLQIFIFLLQRAEREAMNFKGYNMNGEEVLIESSNAVYVKFTG